VSKTELRLRPHQVLPNATVVELWHNGDFIGQVTGADGPGVRVISKYALTTVSTTVGVIEVRIGEDHG
jgi:hypothetical protein